MKTAPLKVWSEREPGSWTECTESAYLMALLYGGHRRFPLGAYSDAERDALDAVAGYPGVGNTFPYLDRASQERYGVKLTEVPFSDLRARLLLPGRALAITGSFAALPAGHHLRRWQPDFVGGHAVCVIPTGRGGVLWLDPLAPDDHPGDKADVETVMRFAERFVNHPREALLGQFASPQEEEDVIDPTLIEPRFFVRVLAGGTAYRDPERRRVAARVWPLADARNVGCYGLPIGSVIGTDGKVKAPLQGGRLPLAPIRVEGRGVAQVWFVGVDKLVAPVAAVATKPMADCDAAVAQAEQETTAKVNQEWREWLATAPAAPSAGDPQ